MARATTFVITLSSFLLTAITISNAFMQKKQFYPSVVYITKSSPSMAVMYLQALVVAYMIFQVARKLFFGQLRASETEHLSERTWHAVMETCLAFTVFRDDFSPRFVMQFVLLLFLKSFHWLCEDRVDFMERSPVITLLFHTRMISLLAFLSALDSYFISHAYFTTLVKGATVQIVFGFEYAVLMTVVLHVTIKYILHMHDLRSVHPWENKAVYLLYSELLINLLRCALYIVFVGVMIRLHTFPLFSIRPLYLTIRAFHKAVNDVILSRRAIHAMNTLFPLATEQELTQGDNTCIICREEMTPMSGAKKLPCGHIFHSNCLRSWFQRQQSCPTCRMDILGGGHRGTPAAGAAGARAGAGAAAGGAANGAPRAGANVPAADLPPNLFPFMAHHFGFPPPPQQQQQQQQANAGEAAPAAADNTLPSGSASTSASTAAPAPSLPPGFVPPPPFMMMPPPVLPPFTFPAAPAFAGLSDAEVAAMESNERAAIEARVMCLRNIGLLLDAATMQLQQYMSIVQALSLQQQGTTNTTADTSTSSQPVVGEATSEGTDRGELSGGTDSGPSGSTTLFRRRPSPESSSSPASSSGTTIVNSPTSTSTDDGDSRGAATIPPKDISPSTDTLREVREVRLRKFGSDTKNSEHDSMSGTPSPPPASERRQ